MTSASESLAAFGAELEYTSIPGEVVERVQLHLLDVVGVALASASMDFGREIVAACRSLGGEGGCAVIGARIRAPAAWAALANGALAHGLDYDDTHQESVVHVSAGIAPAALAAAEEAAASGAEFLAAFVAGLEVSIRIGLAARGGLHDRGFHPTGICNAFGAALLSARLAGLEARGIADAVGIAGSQAAGLLEFLSDGCDVKRIHAGWAAHAGIVAARLAQHGFSGPREVLEGRLGFYRSHLGENGWHLEPVTRDLGRRWHCAEIALKPYPCCHYNHAFADAALRLRHEHRIDPAEIERVECLVAAREIPIVCEPSAAKRAPQTEYGAKFSLPYAVACILVRGRLDLDDFTAPALADAEVLALAKRIDHSVDPTAEFPLRFGGAVQIHMRDGRVLEAREPVNRGSAERPLTRAEVEDKFRRSAGRSLSPRAADAIIGAIDALPRAASLDVLAAAVSLASPAAARERA